MILKENYRTAIQKYGEDIVNRLTRIGLPDNYLLAACRFINETNKPLSEIVSLFKEWNKYVVRFTKIDVNGLSFDKFLNLIENGKISHGMPNVIYEDNIVSVGEIHRAKDTKVIPIDVWCIHSQRKIDNYLQRGYKFFIIRMLSQPLPYTYVMAAIHDGEVEYWDSYNHPHIEDTDGSHEAYQKALPKSIVNLLYTVASQQSNQENINESKTRKDMKQNKKTINEAQLRAIISEAVKSVLNENLSKADDWYRARVVDKLLKSWERYGCMEDAQNAYHRGMYEFLCFISPMLGDADMLTPQEGSEEWDANSEWDFSKQDKEVGEMRKNRLEPSYNPYD